MTSRVQRPAERWPNAWWLYLAAGMVLVAASALAGARVDGLAQLGIASLAVAATVVGVRWHRPVRSAGWYALAASQLVWVGGQAFPTPADALSLAGYPLLALGLLLLIRRPGRDLEGLLDGATAAVGATLLCSVLLARPLVARYADAPLAATVAAAYPLLDLAVLVLLLALTSTFGAATTSLRLLVAAVLLLLGTDLLARAGGLLTGASGAVDPLRLVSAVLVGAAALHPSAATPTRVRRSDPAGWGRRRLVATALTALVPPGTLAVQHLVGMPIAVWPIVVASAALFLLVVTRMTLVLRQVAAADQRRDQAQQQLVFQAAHDSLTGLANRAQALDLINRAIARTRRREALVALLFVDLDGFKAVNDGYGHRAGDEVLSAVAGRMQAAVRQGDVVARLGGDEFVVLLEPVTTEQAAVAVAERLISEVARPVTLASGHPVRVGASVGVAVSGGERTDADALLLEADAAAYRAKHQGRGRVEVFDETLRLEQQDRYEIESSLRAAIAQDALLLRYEPVVDLADDRVVGYEVLVFWERPGLGLVPTSGIRSVATLSDLVVELDTWVLRRAAEQLAEWQRLGAGPLRLGVDISVRHLARTRVVEDVRSAMAGCGLRSQSLLLEVSDLSLVDDPIVLGHLDQIRTLGVLVGLEDFGAGYSSVRRLERLPLDVVKLDGSFIRGRGSGAGGAVTPLLVRGVQNFGLRLVAKGVDEAEDLAFARGIGCDRGQGRHLGEPVEAAEVGRRLAAAELTSDPA